jgi:hypothetical protein
MRDEAMIARRVWEIAPGTVCLRDEDFAGRDLIREFWVPGNGGYVREVTSRRSGVLGQQISGGLSHSGWTLTSSPKGLLDLIRKEYRKAKRREARTRTVN